MNERILRRLIERLCELHAKEQGKHLVWFCAGHRFSRHRDDPDEWCLDSAMLRNMRWHELMAVAALIADCAWDAG